MPRSVGEIALGFSSCVSLCLFCLLMFSHSYFCYLLFFLVRSRYSSFNLQEKCIFPSFSLHSRLFVSVFFRTCRATGVRPESSGARACRLGPGTSGRRPFRLARLRGLALPAQPPLTPRVGNQGGKRDEPGLTAKAHAGSCGKPNPRTRQGRRGRRDARDARRASRKWTRPACGRAATRTKSVTAI